MLGTMRRTLLSFVAFAGFASLGGCYAEEGAYVEGPAPVATVGYSEPDMVVVSPGVSVVYDYDYPVFFNAGLYWRYDGGVWYSSRYHNSGWAVNRSVPYEVRRIDRPEGYRHYRPAGYTPRHAQERREYRREERREEHREVRHEERREQRRETRHDEKKHR